MIDFIKGNKELFISALTLIVSIVALCIKRKPKTLDDFTLVVSEVLSVVPILCSKVERVGEGASKKNEVISSSLELVRQRLGRILSPKEREIVINKVSEQIEEVLKAPQKKL